MIAKAEKKNLNFNWKTNVCNAMLFDSMISQNSDSFLFWFWYWMFKSAYFLSLKKLFPTRL